MGDVVKDERALFVVANLASRGDPRYQLLYQWLDANAVGLAWLLMRPHYGHIHALTGSQVTRSNFVDKIQALAREPQTKALDLFLVMHGSKAVLHFEDGAVSTADLKTQLQDADLKNRLRLLYSTACYGATHANDFVEAGFRVVSGALGVNANGPYDYPAQLYHWSRGERYKSAVDAGNRRLGILTHDAIARAAGFDDVNSEKIIEGKKYTRITSEAM
jgi:hypothetical protein